MKKSPLFAAAMALLLLLLAGQWLLPRREFSEMENRVLAQPPEISLSSLTGGRWGDRFESFAADQIPLRDAFVSLYMTAEAGMGRRMTDGVLRGKDGRMFSRTDGYSERNVRRNAAALTSLSQQTGTPAYLLAVPSAALIYPDAVPDGAPLADESALLDAAAEETNLLPLVDSLCGIRGCGDLYYHTDHHWNMGGAKAGPLRRPAVRQPWPDGAGQRQPAGRHAVRAQGFLCQRAAAAAGPALSPDCGDRPALLHRKRGRGSKNMRRRDDFMRQRPVLSGFKPRAVFAGRLIICLALLLCLAVPACAEESVARSNPKVPTPFPPEHEAVGDEYFEDAVFIGDSIMENIEMLDLFPTANFVTLVGMSPISMDKKLLHLQNDSHNYVTAYDVIEQYPHKKIFILLGSNALDHKTCEGTLNDYRVMIIYLWDKIGGCADNDDAVIRADSAELNGLCDRILAGCSDAVIRKERPGERERPRRQLER